MTTTETKSPKAPKRKLIDAYKATVTISIPLDMSDPASFANAAEAVSKIKVGLPETARVETSATLTKIEAA